MPAVAALAAFSHHLMVTAMMLPILLRLARTQSLPASRLLMPMSLAASLGTTLSLFSAPAFLLAANLLEQSGAAGLHVFSITPIGAALVALGVVYMLLGRWLVPKRAGVADEGDYLRLDRYYTEIVVDGPWTGRPLADFENRYRDRLQVVEWLRDDAPLAADGAPGDVLRARDVLLVRASPDEIASIGNEPGLALRAVARYGDVALCEAAFARAAHVARVRVINQRLAPVTLEPRAGAASFDAGSGRLTLHASSQNPAGFQKALATVLKMKPADVRVVVGDVGGGFGMKRSASAGLRFSLS